SLRICHSLLYLSHICRISSLANPMARRSSEDEYAALDEEEKRLLAEIYPELKPKLERSIERSKKKRAPTGKAPAKPVPVFDISSDEDEDIKKDIVDDVQILEPVAIVDVSADMSRSVDETFHSARSTLEQANASRLSDDSISPPHSFTADEQQLEEEMEGSFVANPRYSDESSFEDLIEDEEDEQEPEGESLTHSLCEEDEEDRVRGDDDEESVHTSDEDFIDDEEEEEEESEMSIDQSFQADVIMATPPNKRVLPPRSTKNQPLTTTGRSMPVPERKRHNPAEVSPSVPAINQREEENDDGSGEESFEQYLRKLREEDQRKKKEEEEEQMEEDSDSDEGKEREDSFVVSDDSVDVIDDEFENGSGKDEEEEESDFKEWGDSSSDDEKENRRTKKKEIKEEKPINKKNLLLGLANSFNSPSVRSVDKESRDPDRHFLLSLSENYDGSRRHPDADSFLKRGVKGEKTRVALVQRLFEIYNTEIFEDKLPSDLSISFNGRLRKTAGYCKWSSRAGKCTVELSPKVCSKPERIRDTLAHELCHAAVFVINRLMKERHGPVWQSWTRKFSSRFRGFPVPSRCHNYEIEAKFVYECDGCGQLIKRHSKSFDTEKKCCGKCHGRFHLRERTDTTGKKREANSFALFVKDNYGEEKRGGGRSHKEIMQLLSARFKQTKTVVRNEENEEEERDVKRLDLDLSVMSIQED
ncbi:hypothetical protein PENTCL1PPCAC_13357, partial [Pristionchus entomophagus]